MFRGATMFDLSWNWAILGIALIIFELATGTFYILCFGIAALLVAGISGLFSFGLNAQLVLFSVFSLVTLGLWHFVYKGNKADSSIGQSTDDTVGKIGQVSDIFDKTKITVSFNVPVMGSRTWISLSDEILFVGDSVRVVSVEGNYLKVEKTQK